MDKRNVLDIARALRIFFQSEDWVMAEILIGDCDGANTVFGTEFKFDPKVIWVYLDGQRMIPTIDYVVSESGGVGTGYDTVTFTFAPLEHDNIIADYCKAD